MSVLLDEGFAHEAAIVARSLFEDSIRLAVLRQAGDNRTGYVFSWLMESMKHAERMLREGERDGRFDPVERDRVIQARRARLMADAARFGVTGRWPRFGSDEQMARQVGWHGEYHMYLYATQLVHGAETAYFFESDPVGDADNPGQIAEPTYEVRGVAVGLAVTSVLRAHIAVAEMLGWAGAPEAQALLDEPILP